MLTREQLLLAAEWVALAQAHAAYTGKEAAEHAAEAAKLHGKHVKTAAGAEWYKQPIGSLIIAKPHPHHLPFTQKIVYAGGHSWAIPKAADVYVPGYVDLNNDAEVALADKWVNLDIEHGGKLVMLGQHYGPGTSGGQQINDQKMGLPSITSSGWKKLPEGDYKQPVTIGGKLAAWVPGDWKLYWTGPKAVGVWGKSPDGKWHMISATGAVTTEGTAAWKPPEGIGPEAWSVKGSIKPYNPADKGSIPPETVPPSPAAPDGPAEAKVSILGVEGPIAVSAKDVHEAIAILNATHNTAVKQPLAKAGHPLAKMDYHKIAKAEIAAFPELKVPSGSKTQHVGQVKLAVLHHLGIVAGMLGSPDAGTQHAETAKDAAKADAAHAADDSMDAVALHDLVASGALVTGEAAPGAVVLSEGAAAVAALKLAYNHNDTAYAVQQGGHFVLSYVKPDPGQVYYQATPQHGLLLHWKGQDEPAYTSSYLLSLAGKLLKPKPEPPVSEPAYHDPQGVILAQIKNQAVVLAGDAGKAKGTFQVKFGWAVNSVLVNPKGKHYVGYSDTFGGPAVLSKVFQPSKYPMYVVQSKNGELQVGAVDKAAGSYHWLTYMQILDLLTGVDPGPALYNEQPGWHDLHELVLQSAYPDQSDIEQHAEAALAYLLKYTSTHGVSRWITVDDNNLPSAAHAAMPVLGTPGAPTGYTVWQVDPDHKVTFWPKSGEPGIVEEPGQIKTLAGDWLKPPVGAPSAAPPSHLPKPGDMGFEVHHHGLHDLFPTGSKVYIAKYSEGGEDSTKYVLTPAGQWWTAGNYKPKLSAAQTKMGALVDDGSIKPDPTYEEVSKALPGHEPDIEVHNALGDSVGYVPFGSKVYYHKDGSGHVWVNKPDGTWWASSGHGESLSELHNWDNMGKSSIASGVLVPAGQVAYGEPASLDEKISHKSFQIKAEGVKSDLPHKLAWAIQDAEASNGTHYVYQVKATGDWVVFEQYPKLGLAATGSKVYKVEPWGPGYHPGAAVTELTPSMSIDSEAAAGQNVLDKQMVLYLLSGGSFGPPDAVPDPEAVAKLEHLQAIKAGGGAQPWHIAWYDKPSHQWGWDYHAKPLAGTMGVDLAKGWFEMNPGQHPLWHPGSDPDGPGIEYYPGKPLSESLAELPSPPSLGNQKKIDLAEPITMTDLSEPLPGWVAALPGASQAKDALVTAQAHDELHPGAHYYVTSNLDGTWSSDVLKPASPHYFAPGWWEVTAAKVTYHPPGYPVSFQGKYAYNIPEDAALYHLKEATPEDADMKWAKYPDGSWYTVPPDKPHAHATSFSNDGSVADGTLVPEHEPAPGKVVPPADPVVSYAQQQWGSGDDYGHQKTLAWKLAKGIAKAIDTQQTFYVSLPSATPEQWVAVHSKGSTVPGMPYYRITPAGDHVLVQMYASPTAAFGTDLSEDETLGLLKGTTPEPEKPKLPTGPPLHVILDGKVSEGIPAGSKIYRGTESSYYGSFSKDKTYVHLPTGEWGYFYSGGSSLQTYSSYQSEKYNSAVSSGKLQEILPATEQDIAEAKDISDFTEALRTGAVGPAADPGDDSASAVWFHLATALTAAQTGPGTTRYVFQEPSGAWTEANWAPGSVSEYWSIDPDTLKVQHVKPAVPGQEAPAEDIPWAKVKEGLGHWVTPNSVAINGKLYKYGHYYKPKGKAHLEIGDPKKIGGYYSSYDYGGLGAKAGFVYHPAAGKPKNVTPHFATTHLESGGDEFHETPKGAPPLTKITQVQYATPVKTGQQYAKWDDANGMMNPAFTYTLHDDGSVTYKTPEGSAPTGDTAGYLIEHGMVLDGYGNSVVKPGVQPVVYRLFGDVSVSHAQLEVMLAKLESKEPSVNLADTLGLSHGGVGIQRAQTLMSDHDAITGQQQRDTLRSLLREMLGIPNLDQAASGFVPTFYKAMPKGIHEAKDAFTFNPKGYVKPPVWKLPAGVPSWYKDNFSYWTSADLSKQIKAISQQFGEGKVLGQHPASMAKDAKADWLTAFKHGNMAQVFEIDSAAGKVSPVHPGAPKNESTHQIVWGPWGDGEIAATEAVPGMEWSDYAKVTLPKAEIANYIIKAGLQHAEYLTDTERREWVTWHRKHDQSQVDELSQRAHERYAIGENTLSDIPQWTDDLQPAKSYDVYLEENTPAANWTASSLQDYFTDHPDVLEPFGQQWQDENGFTTAENYASDFWKSGSSYSGKRAILQLYLEDKAAKELAEKLRPRYQPDPEGEVRTGWTRVKDQFGWQGWWRQAEQEDIDRHLAVARLARLAGYRTPETREGDLDETHGMLHRQPPPGADDLTGASWGQLGQRQLEDIAREHVLDWYLDNPGSFAATYAKLPDGSVVGTDKSMALEGVPGDWHGLARDGTESKYADQLTSDFYKAIVAHQVSHADADQAYIAAIRAARRVAALPDKTYQDILAGAHLSAEAIAALTTRKNALADDFATLWKGVYKSAHWKLPKVPEEKLRFGLHSGFSEHGFFDHVIAAKSFGVPAFFGGNDVEFGNALVWTELAGSGDDLKRLLRGETGVRGDALDKLTAWAKEHQTNGPKNIAPKPKDYNSIELATVQGREAFYAHVVSGAKAVSRHAKDQMWKGPYTTGALQNMHDDQALLTEKLHAAEDAIAAGPDSAEWAAARSISGNPILVQSMAKYYLEQIDKVDHAKANAESFQPGDIPDWEPPKLPEPDKPEEAPKPKPQIKVELKKVVRELGYPEDEVTSSTYLLDKEDGELHVGEAVPGAVFNYPGQAWHICLPTGEVIEFNDSSATSTPKGQIGRIRFKADATQGAASLERVRAFLQEAGMDLPEADDQDMELLYWRHLAGVLADRKDTFSLNHKPVWKELQDYFAAHDLKWSDSGLSSQPAMQANIKTLADAHLAKPEELDLWRKAWAHLTSPGQVEEFVAKGGYLPYLKHWDISSPEVPGGSPVWYRFDADPTWLASQSVLPYHSFHNGGRDAVLMSRTGGGYATETRLRALGTSISGMSSDSDMSNENGSAGWFYLHLGSKTDDSGQLKVSPKVFAQTQTYGFPGDNFGDISQRASKAAFDIPLATKTGTHETLVRDGISLLDDILLMQAAGEKQRQQIIDELKSHGVTAIHGVPVEQYVVPAFNSANVSAAVGNMKALAPHMFDRPEVPYEAPPAAVILHGAIETETEAKGYVPPSHEPGALAANVKGAEAATDHAAAVPTAKLNQLLFSQDSYDSSYTYGSAKAAQSKYDTAARVSAAMTTSSADLAAFHDTLAFQAEPNWGKDDRDRAVAALIAIWAHDNGNVPLGIALQDEARKLFGMPGEETVPPPTPAAKDIEEKYGAILRDFLRAQYALTQKDLAKQGIDKVTVYRTFEFADTPDWAESLKAGDKLAVPPQRAVSAWAYLKEGPGQDLIWGKGQHHLMVKTTVPASLILSSPRSGLGALRQAELTVLDSPGEWEVEEATNL